MTVLEAMHKRTSVRTYLEKPVEGAPREQLAQYLAGQSAGPFGNAVRLTLVDASEENAAQLRRYGVYGVIKGARLFIAGAVRRGPGDMEDFGYCMQGAIVEATRLGLGTVWLGGSFRRGTFAEKLALGDDEALPCVSPVGYAAERPTSRDNLVRLVARSDKRKPFGQLFFDGAAGTALKEAAAGPWAPALEAVRLGPSASNKQPWRVIKKGEAFTFCLDEDKVYNNALPGVHIQNVDLGIAMCNFELSARELELPGEWRLGAPGVDLGKLRHIATFAGR
jgi:nitroreductase